MELYVSRSSYRCSHLFHSHPMYVLRMIALVTEAEREIIDANGWRPREVYLSQTYLDRAAARDAVRAEPLDTSEVTLWNPLPLSLVNSALWKSARLAVKNWALDHTHRITVGGLLRGVHLEHEDVEEIALTETLITDSAEKLSRVIDTAASYSSRSQIISFRDPPKLPARNLRRLA